MFARRYLFAWTIAAIAAAALYYGGYITDHIPAVIGLLFAALIFIGVSDEHVRCGR